MEPDTMLEVILTALIGPCTLYLLTEYMKDRRDKARFREMAKRFNSFIDEVKEITDRLKFDNFDK